VDFSPDILFLSVLYRFMLGVFVRDLLTDPGRLRRGFDKLIERERNLSHNDSEGEVRRLHERLEEIARKRARAQDLALDGLYTREELRAKLSELDEARVAIEKELEAHAHRNERIKALKQDRDATLAAFAGSIPDYLERLSSEERNQVYKLLRLRMDVNSEASPRVTGAVLVHEAICKTGGTGW
jgi:chromosome segregation ATPase